MKNKTTDLGLDALSNDELARLRKRALMRLKETTTDHLKAIRIEVERIIEGSGVTMQEAAAIMGFAVIASKSKSTDGRRGRPAGFSSPSRGCKVPDKYVNPADPTQRWSGRGKLPKWAVQVIESGKSLESMRVVK